MEESTSEGYDVVVIGGGLSGLSAALYLQKGGAKVVVLEARDRVGGRTCTQEVDGLPCDVGGAYVGPTQDRVLRIAKDLGIDTYCVNMKGKSVLNVEGKLSHYEGTVPSLPFLSLLDLNHLIRASTELSETIPPDQPWNAPNAATWDKMTVDQWIQQVGFTSTAKTVYGGGAASVLCSEASEISFLYWLWYVRCAHGLKRLVDTENGAQERKFIGGSQSISDALAKQLGCVRLGRAVNKIQWTESGAEVRTSEGESYTAKYVIVALAPALYNRLGFEPPLPEHKAQLAQHMPMGSIIKTIMFYKTAFWRDKGLNGTSFNDSGPVIYTLDDCEEDGSHPALMGFVLANSARGWSQVSEQDRMQAICQQYALIFQSEEALYPIKYVEKNWSAEEFSGGCYVGVMGPQVMTQFGKFIREPVGPIHFAGTETATNWAGYMDGAVQAGERAAHEILTRQRAEEGSGSEPLPPFQEIEPESTDVPAFYSGLTTLERWLPSPRAALAGLGIGLAIVAGVVARWQGWTFSQLS
jgi:monoamine oxidase